MNSLFERNFISRAVNCSMGPARFEVVSRAQILQGTVRAYAALANGLYYVRNRDTLVCVSLKR